MQIDAVRVVGGVIPQNTTTYISKKQRNIEYYKTLFLLVLSHELCERNGRCSCWLDGQHKRRKKYIITPHHSAVKNTKKQHFFKPASMPIMAENRTEHCKEAQERTQHDTLFR